MALSPFSSMLSDGAMNIDDYFDFDAASCDSSSPTTGWGFLYAQTASKSPASMDLDDSMLEELVLERDIQHDNAYQIEVDLAGIYAGAYHDASLGLPSITQYAFFESPEACDSSDSESCWSAPGSPSSFLSTLSPSPSPISCGADNAEDDVGSFSDVDGHVVFIDTSFQTTSYTAVSNELSSSVFPAEPTPTTTLFFDPAESTSPFATYLHAPCPMPPRNDTIICLESIVQSPPEFELEFDYEESTASSCSDLSPSFSNHPQIIHLDFDERAPSRSPSCSSEGRARRGKKRKTRERVPCGYDDCLESFTRHADRIRHAKLRHRPPTLAEMFRDTSKERNWCMGCLTILSRSDSRRRHEYTCPHFAEYVENGHVRNPMFLPLPEIYSETNPKYRLWCQKCFGTFSHSGERHTHEGGCTGPP